MVVKCRSTGIKAFESRDVMSVNLEQDEVLDNACYCYYRRLAPDRPGINASLRGCSSLIILQLSR